MAYGKFGKELDRIIKKMSYEYVGDVEDTNIIIKNQRILLLIL